MLRQPMPCASSMLVVLFKNNMRNLILERFAQFWDDDWELTYGISLTEINRLSNVDLLDLFEEISSSL